MHLRIFFVLMVLLAATDLTRFLVAKFCDVDDPSTPANYRHNSEAPNLQNKVCNGQSAWEVMRQHEDFRNGNNAPLNAPQNLSPEFTIIKKSARTRVLVFDVSGSMDWSIAVNSSRTRIEHLHQAAVFVIDNILETNSYLGIVWFNDEAYVKVNMTFVDNQATRDKMKDGVPVSAFGGTDIQGALVKGRELLENSSTNVQESEIILISDGESQTAYIHLAKEFANKGIIVHTIAISNSADDNMTGIAAQTGGGSYTYLETNTVSLADVLSQVITTGQSSSDTAQRIYMESMQVTSTITDEFDIDDGLGNDTVVVALLDASSNVTVSLEVVGPDNVKHYTSDTTDTLKLKIPGTIPAGRYTYTINISSSTEMQADVSVKSYPSSDAIDVIRVASCLSDTILDFNNAEEMKLYVTVEKGGLPVLGATVRAVLAADSYVVPRNISLQDSGTGPDARANDGIYSAYLLKKYFTGQSQRYNTKVVVNGDGETFIFDLGSGSVPIPGAVAEPVYEPKPVGIFHRQSFPQEIVVVNFDQDQATLDTTPPARITDFSLTSSRNNQVKGEESITFTLTWTAVGDDMDTGQAANYTLRMDKDITKLRNFFNTTTFISHAIGTPKPAGETEMLNITLTLQDCNGTCYLALTATDSSGLDSSLSNVVVVDVDFSYKSVEYADHGTKLDDEPGGDEDAIVALVVSGIAICLIIAAILVVYYRRRRSMGLPPENEDSSP